MQINKDVIVKAAEWTGPYSWPGFEHYNKLPSLPAMPGVYMQTFEYKDGYLIYLVGHAKNIKSRFSIHEKNRRVGIGVNIFDIDQMRLGVRKRVWNGFTAWWKDNAKPQNLREREAALGYASDWGKDIQHWETRKAVAFGAHWRSVLEASVRQCREFRIFAATFGPEERLRKRLEAGIMDRLYSASPPFCEIPDKGMALSRIDTTKGEAPITVENRASSLLYALPPRLLI
jgi:hypothetical protein